MGYYDLFGLVGYTIIAFAMSSKNDVTTKKLIITACLVNSFYFSFQELYISAGVAVITGIRIWLSLYEHGKKTAWLFILITFTIPVFSPSTDYIAIIPSMLGIIAVFWLKGFLMRFVMLTGTAFWVLNNYIEEAWVGFAGEFVVLTVGIIRLFFWTKQPKRDNLPKIEKNPSIINEGEKIS